MSFLPRKLRNNLKRHRSLAGERRERVLKARSSQWLGSANSRPALGRRAVSREHVCLASSRRRSRTGRETREMSERKKMKRTKKRAHLSARASRFAKLYLFSLFYTRHGPPSPSPPSRGVGFKFQLIYIIPYSRLRRSAERRCRRATPLKFNANVTFIQYTDIYCFIFMTVPKNAGE